jgi:outer membrane receptor protein involved in Fe transport
MNRFSSSLLFFFLIISRAYAQNISGSVTDKKTGEPLIGATVVIEGKNTGTTVDINGKFNLINPGTLPLVLRFSFLGYTGTSVEVRSFSQKIDVKLAESETLLGAQEIVDTRLTEKQRESALTVEALDLLAIKETPAANFYDGLGALKGVDLTAASLGFKVINTRGFNSTSPVRSLQIIDGVDNQAPGLNFSLGNFLGSSELDVQKVDIIVGASSAFYGPNAFNGVISMTTKSPFDYTGLTVQAKVGERNLYETAVRWAQKFKLRNSEVDNLAYKVNLSYMKAFDWEAENYDPIDSLPVGADNPGGYDAVNVYGDEDLAGGNDQSQDIKTYPGAGIFYRNGYREIDLVDYNTENLKLSGSIHYRFGKGFELIAASSFGTGTTVYQGENRFSLRNILFYQNRLELKKDDKFFFRVYATNEDAGDSYDAVLTAFKMLDTYKSLEEWNNQYISNYYTVASTRIKTLPDYPDFVFGQPQNIYLTQIEEFIANNYDSLLVWHQWVRDRTNNSIVSADNTPFAEAGTTRFDSLFQAITSTRFNDKSSLKKGGSLFFDRSALYHATSEYKFMPDFATITIGGSARLYAPNSQGTIFRDTAGIRITNFEYGFYSGIERKFFEERLKLSGTLRSDKNQNFERIFTPAISAVYSPDEKHTVRVSFSSAVRNPTLADQYLYYDVGRAILLGNITGYDSLLTIESFRAYIDGGRDPDLLRYFSVDRLKPEKVRTTEIGYRGTLFKKLFVDASYYFSRYKDFIGYKLGIVSKFDGVLGFPIEPQAYRVSANSADIVYTQGASIGLNYYFTDGYAINANTSWNELDLRGSTDPIIPAFNTPRWKFNIGLTARELRLKNGDANTFGYSFNYKWIEGFVFEGSPQFTGKIPTYDMTDAQVSYSISKWKTICKLGVSNLFGIVPIVSSWKNGFTEAMKAGFDNRQYQVYGGPRIGRLAYFSVTVNID